MTDRKRGSLTLTATVVVDAEHDVGKHLRDLRDQLANRFSCAVHEFYPDARIGIFIDVGDVESLAISKLTTAAAFDDFLNGPIVLTEEAADRVREVLDSERVPLPAPPVPFGREGEAK